MPFINVLGSRTAGPVSWVDSASVRTAEAAILSKPRLSETFAAGETSIAKAFLGDFGSLVTTKTFTFTAPVDMTLRNWVFPATIASTDSGTGAIIRYINTSYLMYIDSIVVAGTGPDVAGSPYLLGDGLPAGMFSMANVLTAPLFNLRLAAGDTVTLEAFVVNNQGTAQVPYECFMTYDVGIDTSVKPTYFVGSAGEAAPGWSPLVAATPEAGGTITVTAATFADGERIRIVNDYEGFSFDEPSGVGGTLTGSSGGGGTGTNTFDSDIIGVTLLRDAILAALQDGGNAWTGQYTFAALSTNAITVLRDGTAGLIGNTDEFTTNSGSISLDGGGNLSGSLLGTSTVPLATPGFDLDLHRVYVNYSLGLGFVPSFLALDRFRMEGLNVGGSPVASFPPFKLSVDITQFSFSEGFVSVPSGTALTVDLGNPLGETGQGNVVAVGTAT